MSLDAWIAVTVTALTIVALVFELVSFEITMATSVTLLMLVGVITPEDALRGFGSTAVLTIGALFVVAAGVRRTGILLTVADRLFGHSRRSVPLLRMMFPAGAVSAFLNNTPIVAMFAPTILDWCKRNDIAPSRMLMPLSYATILGGMCTLIGTSTTLVVDGLMREHAMAPLTMFEISWIGVPVAVIGCLLIAVVASRLLPERRDPITEIDEERREFLVEMLVDANSPLVGKSITEAGLRHLRGLYLIAIERDGKLLSRIGPRVALRGDDRLVFAGLASTVIDVQRFPGLSRAPEIHYDPTAPERRGQIFEAVVSPRSPAVNKTIKDIGFRSRYDAVVIAVHRAGHRLSMKLGEVELKAGDTLMLEAADDFDQRWADNIDFALVSRVAAEPAPTPRKAPIAIAVLVAMVFLVSFELVPIVIVAFAAAACMVLAGVLTAREARRAISVQILIVIACAMGLGKALEVSGAAVVLGGIVSHATVFGAVGILAATFIAAALLNAAVGNVAAAAIVFPVAIAAAQQAGIDARAVAITVVIAASCSFLTPTANPTNLMVYGPGGYRFGDFARLGLPLLVVVFVLTLLIVPWAWPL